MSGAQKYTEDQRQTFVNRAAEIGLTPAIKELGYPGTKATASNWCKQMGVKVELSALQQHAAKIGKFYGATEKLALCQKILDEAYDVLIHGERIADPTAEERVVFDDQGAAYLVADEMRVPVRAGTLSQLTSVVQRTIQTMELLEGRVTERVESVSQDPTDIELAQMIRDYKVQNASTIEELRA